MLYFIQMDAYPLMFSSAHDQKIDDEDLPEYYKTNTYWSYFEREDTWYTDSNFYSNPFEDPQNDFVEEDDFKPMKRSNSYDVLGIDKDSEDEDIKKAFRKKALETHPDKGGDPEEFRKVREAYECLIS